MSLTGEQFESVLAKIPTDKSGAILYVDFLDRFYGKEKTSKDDWVTSSYKLVTTCTPPLFNTRLSIKRIPFSLCVFSKLLIPARGHETCTHF